MSRTLAALVLGALLSGRAPEAQAQSAEVLYQQALRKEQVQGDLDAAIALLRQVVAAGDRALAARALVRMGRSYERLRKPGAEGPYRRVLTEYADQAEPVAEARARLTARGRLNGGNASSKAAAVVIRLVVAAEDLDGMGQVSPDGRLVATVGGASGGGKYFNAVEADLVVHDLATGARRRLTHKSAPEENADKAIWSPDGNRIAYAWIIDPNVTELRTVGVDGSDMTTIFRDPEVPYLRPEAWSADGRHVLTVLYRRDRSALLALVPVAGGAPRMLDRLRQSTQDISVPAAGFSPDQRWAAYSAKSERDSGDQDIFGRLLDGDRKTTLVDHPADDRFLAWSPGGILFTSDRRGTTDLFLLPMKDGVPAGAPALLKVGVGSISPAGLDRRGTVYYQSSVEMSDVFTRPLDPSTLQAAGEATLETGAVEGKSWLFDWSPDGQYFGYLSFVGPSETPTVVVRREATKEEQRVELPVGLEPFALRVAPGGGRVIVAGYKEAQVLLADVAKRTFQTLALSRDEEKAEAIGSIPSYAWSLDGRRIYYTTFGGARRLMTRDLATGLDRELYDAAGRAILVPTPSLDGRLLAFVVSSGGVYGPSAVMLLPADVGGATPRQLVRLDRGYLIPIAFTPDGEYLIYAARRVPPNDQPPLVLYRVPTVGGEPEQLPLPVEGPWLPRLRPDGRRVAFFRDRSVVEIWALEDFTRPRRGDQ